MDAKPTNRELLDSQVSDRVEELVLEELQKLRAPALIAARYLTETVGAEVVKEHLARLVEEAQQQSPILTGETLFFETDTIGVMWTRLGRGAVVPTRGISNDTGYDLTTVEDTMIPANSFADIKTNVAIGPPPGYWCRIVGRSSSLRKHNILVNEGIIDEGYRGELFVGVWNLKGSPTTLRAGTRIAQLIFHPRVNVDFLEVDQLSESVRGASGFGSTGV